MGGNDQRGSYSIRTRASTGVSGVIAVVVLGLGGSATGKWSMSAPIVESGTFDVFWDTISFAVNGVLPAERTLQCRVKPIIAMHCK